MPKVRVGDINMYYEQRGSGEPLVIIGGLASDISEYEVIISWLSEKFQVLCFDNRGVGRTDKPDETYTTEMMAGDTAGLMEKLGITSANVLGMSLGGRIALELALEHPTYVKKLILASSAAKTLQKSRALVKLLGLASVIPVFRSKYPQPRYAFNRQRQASRNYDCTSRLHELKMPTIILSGRKDKISPYFLAEELNAGIEGSQLVEFKGGHIFFFTAERQLFLDEVNKFITETN